MKKMIIVCSLALFFAACGGSGQKDNAGATEPEATEDTSQTTGSENPSYDPNRGEGKFHDVQLSDKLDPAMAAKGQKIAEIKCESLSLIHI